MSNYKSLQMRTLEKVYGRLGMGFMFEFLLLFGNFWLLVKATNAAPATVTELGADIAQANQYYQGLYGKSAGDYAQDAAVA